MFNLILQDDLIFIDKFPEWICKKYGVSIDNKNNWEFLLKENSPNVMETFFKEVELFRSICTSLQ